MTGMRKWNGSFNPNPARNQFVIGLSQVTDPEFELAVYTLDGRVVHQEVIPVAGPLVHAVETHNWADGLYLIQARSAARVWTERLLIQK